MYISTNNNITESLKSSIKDLELEPDENNQLRIKDTQQTSLCAYVENIRGLFASADPEFWQLAMDAKAIQTITEENDV